jgi:adenylate kinase
MSDDLPTRPPLWTPEVKAALNVAAAFVPPLVVVPAFLDYLEDWRERQAIRMTQMSDAAAEAYPGSPQELLERLQADAQVLAMLDTALAASARASTEDKARALGRALANGALARDDAKIDEAAQMLRIIADLEPIEVRTLDALLRIGYGEGQEPSALTQHELGRRPPQKINTDDLTERMGGGLSLASVDGAISVLYRHGLVETSSGLYGWSPKWWISDLGVAVLAFLQDSAV